MTKLLYFGLGLLVGGGIGATTAHFLTKKAVNSMAEKEIEEMHEYFNEKKAELLAEYKYRLKYIEHPDEKVEPEPEKSPEGKIISFKSEDEKPSLEELAASKGYNVNDIRSNPNYVDYKAYSDEDSPEEETGEGENLAHPNKDLYIITDEQYVTECLNYEKRELRFYKEDKTLCNEEDEPLEVVYSVGNAAIMELIEKNEDFVYVRNDILHIDYEIQAMEGSYDEQVLGHYTEE